MGYDAGPLKRQEVSKRENHMERESEKYNTYYNTCDVNGFLRDELQKVKAGDKFRGNCHLLPQAEYFDMPYGITKPIDVRGIPDSFNEFMTAPGHSNIQMSGTAHN